MFEGNTFFPVTGMPIRKIACMISPLADADPVPLAVAILNAKSLVWFIEFSNSSALSCQSRHGWARHRAADGNWNSIELISTG